MNKTLCSICKSDRSELTALDGGLLCKSCRLEFVRECLNAPVQQPLFPAKESDNEAQPTHIVHKKPKKPAKPKKKLDDKKR